MPSNRYLQEIINRLKSSVEYFLEKLYLFEKSKSIKSRVNDIVAEGDIYAQTEMVKRTLAEREKQIAEKLRSGKEIRQAKDLTRQDLYTTLIKGKRNNKAKNNTNAFTK
jgi:hypothetical protein